MNLNGDLVGTGLCQERGKGVIILKEAGGKKDNRKVKGESE